MEEKKSIAEKLLEFQTSVDTIKKDGKNPHFKSTYATLPHILAEVKPILNALKLVVVQPLENNEVCTMIVDVESNEQIKSSVPIPAGLNAQQTGSAITYFRRYTLCSLLALEIDEDDDGNAAAGNVRASQPAAQPSNPPENKKPPLKSGTPAYTKAVDHIATGGAWAAVEKTYYVSPEIKKAIESEAKTTA